LKEIILLIKIKLQKTRRFPDQAAEGVQGNIAVALEKQLVEDKEELGKSDIANFAEVPFSERKKKKIKMITITKTSNPKSKKPSKK